MAYGFVTAYALGVTFATWIAPSTYPVIMPATAILALAGAIGALFPDLDQLEFWAPKSIGKYFTHKKTFHYLTGYLILTVILVILATFFKTYSLALLVAACWSFAASIHSMMDPLDGWRDDHPEQGIYEHVTRKWLPSLRLIHFAGMAEWVVQAFAGVCFVAISANLGTVTFGSTISASQLIIPGWQVGTLVYLSILLVSAAFDARLQAPKRQAREMPYIRSFQNASAIHAAKDAQISSCPTCGKPVPNGAPICPWCRIRLIWK
jgi:hypothetical protein